MGERTQMLLRAVGLSLLAAGAVLTGLSCGGADLGPPDTGSLEISTVTSGEQQDPDGYSVALDGGTGRGIGLNATLSIPGVSSGSHSVRLNEVAATCTVDDDEQSVTVPAGGTAHVTFTIACAAQAAGLGLTVQPSASALTGEPFAQQPVVQVVDGVGQPFPSNGVTVTASIASGGGALGGTLIAATDATGRARFTDLNISGAPGERTLRFDAPGLLGVASMPVMVEVPPPIGRIAWIRRTVFGAINCGCELWVMNGDGSGQTSIAPDFVNIYQFAWAPDGSKIAFVTDIPHGPDFRYEIYVINADGTAPIRITNFPSSDEFGRSTDPAWSPDGRRIAFVRDQSDIYIVNPDGSGQTNLTNTPDVTEREPVWSPLGDKIIFQRFTIGSSGVYLMNPDGSGQIALTDFGGTQAKWSPTGEKILFVSQRDGNSEVYAMNADGTGQENLSRNPGEDQRPAWSPDGSKIVFTSDRDGSDGVMVMNADGSMPARLASGRGGAWSPDGGRIAYLSTTGIWVMHSDGSGQTQLTDARNENDEAELELGWAP